jgi:hypothetical protein
MDRAKCKAIRIDIFEALKAVEQKHGVKFDAGVSARFGQSDMRLRLSCVEGKTNEEAMSNKYDYEQLSQIYKGLPKIGDWVMNDKYKVYGYKETSQYMWVLVESAKGAKYRVKHTEISPKAVPAPKKSGENRFAGLPANAINQFESLENRLSPENLACDGEISQAQVRKRYKQCMKEWHDLEAQWGVKIEPYV